ncbi:unnamed protein product [Ectocarpus sp. CCAP 1310/34]|nr:unnamed protein product [Ectocarpus sp. CCAP 1310/34]
MLSVEYLGFLWLKVVTVIDDEVFGSLLETLALHDVMFLFDDDGNQGRVGDLMVPARLPGSVSEASLAMLKQAVSQSTRMQLVITADAEHVPPATIPLFLGGFCCRENIVFCACRTRGLAFMMSGQECLDVSKVGFRAKGSMEQLLEQYYPGLQLDASADPTEGEGKEAWQDSLKGLRGTESLGLDEALANRLSRPRAGMQLDELAPTSGAGIGGLNQTERNVLTSIAQNVAFMRWPIPRLVWLLLAPDSGEPALTAEQRCNQAKGRRLVTRKLRLFFRYSHHYSLAVCGPGGARVTELLNWAKKAKSAAKVGLAVASIALKVCIGLAIPRMDLNAAFGASTGDVVTGVVEEAATSSIDSMTSAAGGRIESGGQTERLEHAGVNAGAMEKVQLRAEARRFLASEAA